MKEKERILGLFQTISENYDRANDRISFGLHRLWKKRLIREITKNVPSGASILDICCGTGDMCLLLEKQKKNYQITGVDFSPNMLSEAEKKLKSAAGIRWVLGDAMNLPFEDACFDCAVISFGLRNTPDYLQVLREMHRVLKQNGMICCLDSFSPDHAIVRPFYRLYFKYIMPVWGGGSDMREEYKWLNASTEQFVSKEQLLELFEEAGFQKPKYQSFLCGCSALHTGYKA